MIILVRVPAPIVHVERGYDPQDGLCVHRKGVSVCQSYESCSEPQYSVTRSIDYLSKISDMQISPLTECFKSLAGENTISYPANNVVLKELDI